MATEREHLGQGAAPTAAAQQHSVAPGRHALAGDKSESGKEAVGNNYSSPTLFDSDAGGGDAPVALSVSESIAPGGEALGAGVHGKENPTEVAEEGFQGKAGPLPFQAQLERSFGVPLGGVKAYTDENAQHTTAKLGADAYASGNRVAFGTANPTMGLVAHELTHVLQHTGKGSAKKSTNGGGGGIETSGEHEAEAVESAVAAGRPASSALQGEGGKGGKVTDDNGPGPALKAGQKPALSTPFSTGMTFSPTSFEQSASYSLWDAPQFRVPIATVPGLSFCVSPSVSVGVGGGVDWKKKAVTARLSVDGGVGLSLNYGVPAVAEMYGGMEASASGGFSYERTRGGGDSQSRSVAARDSWSLDGAITLSANLMCGVKLGGGVLDKKFQFGRTEIGKLTGLKWENGRFQRGAAGWAWGPKPLQMFREVKQAIDRAKYIATLPAKAAAEAWKGMKNAGGWAAGRLYNGVTSILGNIKDAGGAVVGAINPFD